MTTATLAHCPLAPTGSHRERMRFDVSTAKTQRRNRPRPGGDQAKPTTLLVDSSAAIEKSSRFWGKTNGHSVVLKQLARMRVILHLFLPWSAESGRLSLLVVYDYISECNVWGLAVYTMMCTNSPAATARSPSADQSRLPKQDGNKERSTGLSILEISVVLSTSVFHQNMSKGRFAERDSGCFDLHPDRG